MAEHADLALEIVGEIYREIGSEQQWDRIFARTQETLSLVNVTMMEIQLPHQGSRMTRLFGVDEKTRRAFDEYYWQVNPFTKKAAPTLGFGSLIDAVPMIGKDTWLHTEFYNDFSRPVDVFYVAGSVPCVTGNKVTALSCQRNERAGPYSRDDLVLIEAITPHLGNRIELEHKLARTERARRALEQALDALGTACLVLDERARVIFANRHAEYLLSVADGLELNAGDHLAAREASSATALRAVIREAIQLSLNRSIRHPKPITIERPSGKRAYTLFACPLDPGQTILQRAPHALIFVNDPSAAPPAPGKVLECFFGLTPAESRVARELLGGKSPKEIADEFGTSPNTIRTQVKSVLAKTNTRRQSELVSLILRTLGPFLHQRPGA